MIRHYVRKYDDVNGVRYSESWLQIDIFGKTFYLFRKKNRVY